MCISTIVRFLLLITALCGSLTAAIDTRIVNGHTANNTQYPYMVSLRDTSNVHFCGGSILNTRWLLTSGQCLESVSNFTVVVGTNSLTSGGATYRVATFKRHPFYDLNTLSYDAGIVKTTRKIIYSGSVLPVYLTSTLPTIGTNGDVTGWGYISYPMGAFSNNLKVITTKLINQADCQNQLLNVSFTVQSTQICAISTPSGPCLADDGGPLALGYIQYGIVSVYSCGLDYPDVYTSIENVYEWVISNI